MTASVGSIVQVLGGASGPTSSCPDPNNWVSVLLLSYLLEGDLWERRKVLILRVTHNAQRMSERSRIHMTNCLHRGNVDGVERDP